MEMDVRNDSPDKICRTCLSNEKNLINLFNYDGILPDCDTKISLCNMLISVACIQINRSDGLPDEICHDCLEKASIAYNFKVSCHKADAILRKLPLFKVCKKNNKEIDSSVMTKTVSALSSESLLIKNEIQLLCDEAISNKDSTADDIYKDVIETFSIKSDSEYSRFIDVSSNNDNIVEKDEPISNSKDCNNEFHILEISKHLCSICQKLFPSQNQLEIHKKSHSTDAKYECQFCNKSYSHKYYLQHHLITHTENKGYLCSICGKCFHLSRGLRQHLKYHKGKLHSCGLCDKKYFNMHMLREHIRCSHSTDRYNHTCTICNKKFTAKSTLKNHMKTHTGVRDHACDKCGKKYTRATYLRDHLRKHTNEPPPKIFICTYDNCERTYTTKASLAIHTRQKHTMEKPYGCDTCEKKFTTMSGLKSHERIHNNHDRQQCVLCDRFLTNKMSLKKHMRLHTGERPYQCDSCGERFISSSIRSEHMQSKHMEKQHECPICKKRFHLRRILRGHMNIHSKEKYVNLLSTENSNEVNPTSADTKQNVPEPGFEVIL